MAVPPVMEIRIKTLPVAPCSRATIQGNVDVDSCLGRSGLWFILVGLGLGVYTPLRKSIRSAPTGLEIIFVSFLPRDRAYGAGMANSLFVICECSMPGTTCRVRWQRMKPG